MHLYKVTVKDGATYMITATNKAKAAEAISVAFSVSVSLISVTMVVRDA